MIESVVDSGNYDAIYIMFCLSNLPIYQLNFDEPYT